MEDAIGTRIKQIREKEGKSIVEVASSLSISPQAVWNLENGKVGKTLEKLPKLAKALGCRIDDLFPEMDESAEDRDDLSDFEG